MLKSCHHRDPARDDGSLDWVVAVAKVASGGCQWDKGTLTIPRTSLVGGVAVGPTLHSKETSSRK